MHVVQEPKATVQNVETQQDSIWKVEHALVEDVVA